MRPFFSSPDGAKRPRVDRPDIEGYLKGHGINTDNPPTENLFRKYTGEHWKAHWEDFLDNQINASVAWRMIATGHKKPEEEAAKAALERQKAMRDAKVPLSFLRAGQSSYCVIGPKRPVTDARGYERYHLSDYTSYYSSVCADRVFALKCERTGDDMAWAKRKFGGPRWNITHLSAKTFSEAIFYMKLAGGTVGPHETDVVPNDPRIEAGLLHPDDVLTHVKWLDEALRGLGVGLFSDEKEKWAKDGKDAKDFPETRPGYKAFLRYSFLQEYYLTVPPSANEAGVKDIINHLFENHRPARMDRSIMAYGLHGFGNFNDVRDGSVRPEDLIGQTRMVGEKGLVHIDPRHLTEDGRSPLFFVHVSPGASWLWVPMGVNDYCIVLSPGTELNVLACERVNGTVCIELLAS